MATTFLKPKNNAFTKTAEVCLIGAGTVAVVDGSVFPLTADGDFHVTIDSEIILVTANATNTLTITRGREGTAAAAHGSGVAVRLLITAEATTEIHTAFARTATKVVAASDADSESYKAADYRGDGTADDVQIQAAIDA